MGSDSEWAGSALSVPPNSWQTLEKHETESGIAMEFEFTQGDPITEEEAFAQAKELGLHAFAFDTETAHDTDLHWHEFSATIWLVAGEANLATEDGTVYHATPGCRLSAPAGWLHQELMSPAHRLVIGTDIPVESWSQPVDKPAAELSV